MRTNLSEEYEQMAETERYEEERYQQAQDVYEWQLANVPIRDDFDSDDEFEDVFADWQTITTTLLDRVKELQRVT